MVDVVLVGCGGRAIDALERTGGRVINEWILRLSAADRLDMGREVTFDGPDLSVLTG